jgi:hypothetical protein
MQTHPFRFRKWAAAAGACLGLIACVASPGFAAEPPGDYEQASPTLSIDDVVANEGDGGTTTFTFTVTLSKTSASPVMVDFDTADWTADASDYNRSSGTLTIPANTASGPISVQVIGDILNEDDEYFIVTLSSPINATITNPFGIGTILNDDDTVSPTLSVKSPNGGETLTTGTMANLTWNASDNVGVTHVDLLMSFNGGVTYKILRKNHPNTGSYSWNVHGPPTAAAVFKVVAYDAAGNDNSDESDAIFEIIAGPTDVELDAIPDFELARIAPNPAIGPVGIDYAVAREAKVRLTVLDVQGRVVAVLADELKAPGRYRAVWARNTDSGIRRAGVYFVRYEVAGRSMVKRFTVLQ